MAGISRDEVVKVAALANLEIPESDLDMMAENLSDILTHIELLQKLDTSNVSPTSHVIEVGNVFREDEVKQIFDNDRSLDNAPAKDKNYFSVPRVIE